MKLVSEGWRCSFRFLALERATICNQTLGRSFWSPHHLGVPFLTARLNAITTTTKTGHHRRALGFASSFRLHIVIDSPDGDLPASFGAIPTPRSSPFRIRSEAFRSAASSSPRSEMAPDVLSNTDAHRDPSPPLRGFQIVVAATQGHGIGKQGTLPWKLPTDMRFFKSVTTATSSPERTNAVIMGRRTWESIPGKFRPLPGRLNVVLSRSGGAGVREEEGGVVVSESLDAALALLASGEYAQRVERVFVIGGGQVYREAMASPLCQVIHLTEVEGDVDCDTFMSAIDPTLFRIWAASVPITENDLRISFLTYVRGSSKPDESPSIQILLPKPVLEAHDEYQYLNLIDDIIKTGAVKGDRTGTGTISKFGCQMRFNLRKSFPLLTTKRVFWRGVVEELLWFISGSTNAKVLQEKGVNIWDGNGSREYLDKLGLKEREEGDLGPVYGFQWRHFGAKYVNMHADYTGQGFDQLKDVIQKIKTDPNDRRILLSAWNPADLKLMALPPCHMFAQFYVANGELSCQMYQRSCDMGLGVPFNIASYALLTCILAHVCDLVPGDFIHVLGDAHVYKNHVEPLQEQLRNVPKPFPRLHIKTLNRDVDSFVAADFELINYDAHKQIRMKMAV